MMNNVLALVIIVVTLAVMIGRPSRGWILAALAVVSGVCLIASAQAATVGDLGPALAIVAFVGTFGLIYFFNRSRKG